MTISNPNRRFPSIAAPLLRVFVCVVLLAACRLNAFWTDLPNLGASDGGETGLTPGTVWSPISRGTREQVEEALQGTLDAMASGTNTIPLPTQLILPKPPETNAPATPDEALRRRMAAMNAEERRLQMLPGSTNFVDLATNAQRFEVKGYELIGNTLLPPEVTELVLRPYIATNVTFDLIRQALVDLHTVYFDWGYVTVGVGLPPQTNKIGIVKVLVSEGRLSDIVVTNNHYFSSNNVMRALPGLRANMYLNGPVFQAELDRANANQDRQIYPRMAPGPETNTTSLVLKVEDRLPLHAKIELNNQSSPGTPDLRVNTSAVYNNLWQQEQSLGVQYSFSPEEYKAGNQWAFYDEPLVANYSAFYRIPLGFPEAIEDVIATKPGSFGYDEASRHFRLPPPSGRPEFNLFASRSTIDTGLETLDHELILDVPGVRQVSRTDVQEDLTVTSDVGGRLSVPMKTTDTYRSTFSGGLDYKTFDLKTSKTNIFQFTEITVNANGSVNPPIISTVASPVPETTRHLDYLPLSFRYDASLREPRGVTTFGMGASVNLWYSGTSTNLHLVTGSRASSGHWIIFTPSVVQDIVIHTNWTLTLRADGQWSSEPLISNEQYGAGGVASVRGYHEGEVFGDDGWHIGMEQKTPPHVIGVLYGQQRLTVRGSLYMDYADVYLQDPQGRDGDMSLWSVGLGAVIAAGSHWEARFLFSVPLLTAGTTPAYQPAFNFALTAQF